MTAEWLVPRPVLPLSEGGREARGKGQHREFGLQGRWPEEQPSGQDPGRARD